jgi:DNA-directed RNA polymerase subunit E'/Rpb7
MVNYLSEQVLRTTIFIQSNEITTNITTVLLKVLKQKIEDKCNHIGFVIKDTISIVKKSMGIITTNNNKSMVKYNVSYKCKILSPSVGDIIECYVNNKNKMGIIGYVKLHEIIGEGNHPKDDMKNSPLIIIIPLNRINDSESISINDKITIKVNAVRNKFNEDKIQVVGTNQI